MRSVSLEVENCFLEKESDQYELFNVKFCHFPDCKKDLSMYVKGCQTVNKCIVMVVTKAEVVFRRRRNYSQVLTVRAVGILGCG